MPEPREEARELVRDIIDEAKRLARAELALARRDAMDSAKGASKSAAFAGAGAALGLSGLVVMSVGIGLALSGLRSRGATLAGLAMLGGAGAMGAVGVKALPKKPFEETRKRLHEDAEVAAHALD